jgi:hypothetical protein
MMANNEQMAAKLNLNSCFVQAAIVNNSFDLLPPLGLVAATFKEKTLALNVYYEELFYTRIEEEPKLEIVVKKLFLFTY